MSSSSFHSKKDGLAKWLHTQLDLFDHSVNDHTVDANLLCIHRAPKARCMMSTSHQEWHEYNLAQTTEKSRFLELLHSLCRGIEEPVQTMGRPRIPLADMLFAVVLKVYSIAAFPADAQPLICRKRRDAATCLAHRISTRSLTTWKRNG
jgi:hypothetical protein